MDISRVFDSQFGIHLLSALIGLGASCIFKSVCNEKQCIDFKGPALDMIHPDKSFQFGDKCFKYELVPVTCDLTKETIELSNKHDEGTIDAFRRMGDKGLSMFHW